ncbi:MAG: hypothetical protein KBD76_15675 [Bacteriovorax sp.]|nr:hypothetical protein [Bacteriovorax sp.]
MSRGYNRKIILINKSFQLSIMGWFALLSIALVTVFYISVWSFFNSFIREATAAGLPPEHVFFTFMAEQQSVMNKTFILASLVSTFIIFVGGLFLSHKVAGPLYRGYGNDSCENVS